MTATLTVADPAPTIPPAVVPPAPESPGLLESDLPSDYHRAYGMRLQGIAVEEIAAKFGKDRTTIWRWCKAVETEYLTYLESTPTFNMVAEQLKRLRDIEQECRRAATAARSERAKAMFLANALKAIQATNDLLMDCGIVERAAERLFKVVANVKPTDFDLPTKPRDERSRAELIGDLIAKLSNATPPL